MKLPLVFFLCAIILLMIFLPFSFEKSFAQTNLTYKIIFISSWNECSSRNIQALEFYHSITKQYLSKYGFNPIGSSACYTLDFVQNNAELISNDVMKNYLPIVVLDANIGLESLLLEENAWGHYKFEGSDYREIVFCACSPYVEARGSGWTLSHELAHFVLQDRGYSSDVWLDWVHQVDALYEQCKDKDSTVSQCPQLWNYITSPSGKIFPVMEIYDEVQTPNQTTQPSSDTQVTSNFILIELISNEVLKINKVGEFSGTIYGCDQFANPLASVTVEKPNGKTRLPFNVALTIDCEFSFTHSFSNDNAIGGFWKFLVKYGSGSATFLFYVTDFELFEFEPLGSGSTSLPKKTFDINPTFLNGDITSYQLNSFANKLILKVNVESSAGMLYVTLPRELIDSKFNNADKPFTVSVGGKYISSTDSGSLFSLTERKLGIPVSSELGSTTIIITGTQSYDNAVVVPEFNEIAIMILGSGIIGIIAISKKFKILNS